MYRKVVSVVVMSSLMNKSSFLAAIVIGCGIGIKGQQQLYRNKAVSNLVSSDGREEESPRSDMLQQSDEVSRLFNSHSTFYEIENRLKRNSSSLQSVKKLKKQGS
jgi:hypothetical protein